MKAEINLHFDNCCKHILADPKFYTPRTKGEPIYRFRTSDRGIVYLTPLIVEIYKRKYHE